MKRDELKTLLGSHIEDADTLKSVIDSVMSMNGKDIETYKAENEKLSTEINEYKNNVDELTKKLGDSDDVSKVNETLKSELETWKSKFDSLVEQNKAETRERKIKSALEQANCTDVDFALYKIGKDNFIFNNDNELIGFDDTIKEFKENHSNFFTNQKKSGSPNPDPDSFKDDELADKKSFEDACKNLGW